MHIYFPLTKKKQKREEERNQTQHKIETKPFFYCKLSLHTLLRSTYKTQSHFDTQHCHRMHQIANVRTKKNVQKKITQNVDELITHSIYNVLSSVCVRARVYGVRTALVDVPC